MRNSSGLVSLICLILLTASCSKKPIHTSKTLEPPNARPKAGSIEWIDRLQYNDDHDLAYGIFNDDTSLVIRTMTKNRETMMKIFAAGFRIGIDTNGKKDPQFLVNYPLPQGMRNMPAQRATNQVSAGQELNPLQSQSEHHRLKTALNRIELEGFTEEAIQSTTLNTRTGNGITAWIQVDSLSTFYYELAIPLEDLYLTRQTAQKIISVKLESGEMEMPERNGPPANMTMRPGGSGERGGGRQGGGGPPGDGQMQGRMQNMSQPIEILVKRIELQ